MLSLRYRIKYIQSTSATSEDILQGHASARFMAFFSRTVIVLHIVRAVTVIQCSNTNTHTKNDSLMLYAHALSLHTCRVYAFGSIINVLCALASPLKVKMCDVTFKPARIAGEVNKQLPFLFILLYSVTHYTRHAF